MAETTTISVRDISKEVWRKVKASASLRGQNVSAYLNEVLSRAEAKSNGKQTKKGNK